MAVHYADHHTAYHSGRLKGCRGTHASCLALKDFKSNPLEPFEMEQRLAGRFDDWVCIEQQHRMQSVM